ncbi:response regulator transcription factor [Dyadobacter arcticus]|nr:response regulator transcription factor [Dyadobacter arcticus]
MNCWKVNGKFCKCYLMANMHRSLSHEFGIRHPPKCTYLASNIQEKLTTMIRVLIYEDNSTLRGALEILIEGSEGFMIVGAFGDALDVENQVEKLSPDVILMDISMPGQSGIEAVKKLQARFAHVEVLMVTVFDDDESVFEALKGGATGYLLKKTPPAEIISAIRQVYEGGSPMSPSIARRVLLSFQPEKETPEMASLTQRERHILGLLAQGLSYKLVASEALISVETVRTHIKRIYEKLQVHSVTEALAQYRH